MAIKPVSELAEQSLIKLGRYQRGEVQPVKTGREWLDSVFGGLLPGDIVTIAGSSGSGKSFENQRVKNFIMNLDNNPSADKFVWLDHSLEMRLLSNITRDLNNKLKKSKKRIYSEEFTEEEKLLVRAYYENLTDGRFFIDEEPTDADTFEKNMREFLGQHRDKEAVFVSIDHIALSKAKSGQKKNAVDDTVEVINKLKKDFPNTYWIILSQLNREIEKRSKDKDYDAKPNRGDLYQSDTIYHISDYVYVPHNPFRLGVNAFMRFNEARYEEYEEHFIERKGGKASFDSLGKIFYVILKIREAGAVFQDVYIEEIDIPNIEKYRDSREEKSGPTNSTPPPTFMPVVDFSETTSLNKFAGIEPF